MSINLECEFIETRDGKHYFRLENAMGRDPDEDEDYGHEVEYDTFGPFPSFEAAHKALHDNFANPGGFSTLVLTDEPDGHLAAALASATIPSRPAARFGMGRW